MNKKIFRCFLSLFASALMAHAVQAEQSATFTLQTPCYYIDNLVVWDNPDFVSGTRGSFMSFESFPATATYYCESDSGYHVSKWVLRTVGISGNKTIKTWENTSSISISFDYKWASKYGTALELIVYVDQLSYSVSFDPNGGEWTAGEPEGGTYNYQTGGTTPSADSVEKDNATLKGWKSPGGSLVGPGESFSGSDLNVTSDGQSIVLYAQWGAATYSVTLNKDGGTVAKGKDVTSYEYGKGATLPALEKKDAKFEGWYDNPQFVGSVVSAISKTDSGDKEFWAKFVRQDTVVHYNGNGSTSGDMADSSFADGKTMTLRANAFKRAYTVSYDSNGGSVGKTSDTATFTFMKWNNKPNGSGSYTYYDKQDVTNPCGSTGDPVTLYAQWNSEPVMVTLPNATSSEGKVFEGWYTEGGIRVGGAGDGFEPPRNITLYARWKGEKKYTIRFSPNADVSNPNAMPDEVHNLDDNSIPLPACKYDNPASTECIGWEYGGKTYTIGDTFTPPAISSGELVILRAIWKKDCGELSKHIGLDNAILTASYEGAGTGTWFASEDKKEQCLKLVAIEGNGHTSILSMVVVGRGTVTFRTHGVGNDNTGTICAGSQKPQPFTVTAGDDFGTPVTFEVTEQGRVEVQWRVDAPNKTIYLGYVTWTPEKDCTLKTTVSPNDSAGTVSGGGTYAINSSVTLTATAKSGYTFTRWSDGYAQASHTIDVTCDETYQAVFSGGPSEESNYYILFDGNGAYNLDAMDGQQMPCGTATALTANKFTRSGFKFLGWAKERYGEVAYADKASVKDLAAKDGAATLYAVWEEGAQPEPGKTAVTVTITGTTKTVKYTGKKQTISGYTFKSDVAAYKESYCKFTGVAKVSGTEVGQYPMGLEESDFTNKSDDYSVTFVVNDGLLVITGDDPGPTPGPTPEPGPYASAVGEAVEVDLAADCEGYTIKSVSGLPTGLKYSTKTGLVTGTPTKAVSKEDNVTITFTDKTKVKATWTVEALPKMMVGTYYGAATVDGIAGQFQLKLAATGKATGYFYAAGKKISFKSTGLAAADDGYGVTVSYTYNKAKCTDGIVLKNAVTVDGVDVWSATLGAASEVMEGIDARRDTIKECFGKVVPKTTTYAAMEKTDEGEYLNAKVTTAGAVTVSGKLLSAAGKLTSVSCSTHLVVGDDGLAYCYITIYKAVSKSEPIVYDAIWYLPED